MMRFGEKVNSLIKPVLFLTKDTESMKIEWFRHFEIPRLTIKIQMKTKKSHSWAQISSSPMLWFSIVSCLSASISSL